MLQNLNEYYYGKNKLTEKIDAEFDYMVEYISEQGLNFFTVPEVQFASQKKTIEKLLCELFGFSDVFLSLSNTGTSNACTYPIGVVLSFVTGLGEYKVVPNEYGGVRYDGNNVSLMTDMDISLIYNSKLTGSELTAILLHEIGHNFFENAPIPFAGRFFTTLLNIPGHVIISLLRDDKFVFNLNRVSRNVDDYTERKIGGTALYDILLSMTKILYVIQNAGNRLKGILQSIVGVFFGHTIDPMIFLEHMNIFEMFIGIPLGIKNEKFADNFASTYGYGSELITALKKLEAAPNDVRRVINNTPIPYITGLATLPITVTLCMFDPHPDSLSRTDEIVKHLESESKKIKDPKLKKLVERDLKDAKSQLDELKKINFKKSMNPWYKLLVTLMYKLTGHADLRDLILKTRDFDHKQFTNTGRVNSFFK